MSNKAVAIGKVVDEKSFQTELEIALDALLELGTVNTDQLQEMGILTAHNIGYRLQEKGYPVQMELRPAKCPRTGRHRQISFLTWSNDPTAKKKIAQTRESRRFIRDKRGFDRYLARFKNTESTNQLEITLP